MMTKSGCLYTPSSLAVAINLPGIRDSNAEGFSSPSAVSGKPHDSSSVSPNLCDSLARVSRSLLACLCIREPRTKGHSQEVIHDGQVQSLDMTITPGVVLPKDIRCQRNEGTQLNDLNLSLSGDQSRGKAGPYAIPVVTITWANRQ